MLIELKTQPGCVSNFQLHSPVKYDSNLILVNEIQLHMIPRDDRTV